MFHIPRRLVLHTTPSYPRILSRARHASTETKTKSKASSASLSDAITNPPPPIKWIYMAAAVICGAHIFFEYFFTYGDAYGHSMLPTMNSVGDSLIISKFYRRGRYVQIGDLVSFKHPIDERAVSVKRVLGMPGDFVLRDTPGTSGMMMQVPEGHCWVVGDNLPHSRDSRIFGPLPLALIKGKIICSFSSSRWPHGFDRGLQDPGVDGEDVD